MLKSLLLSTTALFIFTGCFGDTGPEKWTSYIYPDKLNSKRSMQNGIFDSLKECQDASLSQLKSLNLETRGDYKCGLDCNYHEGMKTQICKQMTK